MTTEPPRPDQIQANVAAALSRLRGELAPTPPSAPAAQPTGLSSGSHAPAPEAEPILTAPEALFDVGPGLEAPDPSMAMSNGDDETIRELAQIVLNREHPQHKSPTKHYMRSSLCARCSKNALAVRPSQLVD